MFVLENRKKSGTEYSPNSLHHIVCGIMRYVRATEHYSLTSSKTAHSLILGKRPMGRWNAFNTKVLQLIKGKLRSSLKTRRAIMVERSTVWSFSYCPIEHRIIPDHLHIPEGRKRMLTVRIHHLFILPVWRKKLEKRLAYNIFQVCTPSAGAWYYFLIIGESSWNFVMALIIVGAIFVQFIASRAQVSSW